jgi:hypothetical protein
VVDEDLSWLTDEDSQAYVRKLLTEGSAVQSLLENLRTDEISPKFLKALRQETSKMALQYPDYLHYEALEAPALTPQE